MQYYAIDRIEGGFAVCEDDDGARVILPLAQVPDGAREGDVLALEDGRYTVDAPETARRRAQARALEDELFR